MRKPFDLCRMVAISAMIAATLLVGVLACVPLGRALAQETNLSQIQNDASNASFMAGRIETRVRQVRTLAYVTLGLAAIGVALATYSLFRERPARTPDLKPNFLARWQQDKTLARLRRRQRELVQAVTELQDFADMASRRNQEMSSLLASVKARMEQIETAIEEHPPRMV